MSCQPIAIDIPGYDRQQGGLMCNTTDWLFGPLFNSISDAEAFCVWLSATRDSDPRRHADDELIQLKAEWETMHEVVK